MIGCMVYHEDKVTCLHLIVLYGTSRYGGMSSTVWAPQFVYFGPVQSEHAVTAISHWSCPNLHKTWPHLQTPYPIASPLQ